MKEFKDVMYSLVLPLMFLCGGMWCFAVPVGKFSFKIALRLLVGIALVGIAFWILRVATNAGYEFI